LLAGGGFCVVTISSDNSSSSCTSQTFRDTLGDVHRILIVDDDNAMRLVIKEHLSTEYEIIETGAPETALAIALEHRPDAILLDLSMPGLSGYELCHAFSSLSVTQHIPIIIVSGEDVRDKAFCLKLGASSYFSKPVNFPKLRAGLAQLLNAKRDERREHTRIQLRVVLKLTGLNKDGTALAHRAITEDMSKGGFLCSCDSSLDEGLTVQVILCGERELTLGHARLVRVIKSATSVPKFGFQFIGTAEASDLISQLKSTVGIP
jgi:CheY-like chemotaxis protein